MAEVSFTNSTTPGEQIKPCTSQYKSLHYIKNTQCLLFFLICHLDTHEKYPHLSRLIRPSLCWQLPAYTQFQLFLQLYQPDLLDQPLCGKKIQWESTQSRSCLQQSLLLQGAAGKRGKNTVKMQCSVYYRKTSCILSKFLLKVSQYPQQHRTMISAVLSSQVLHLYFTSE